ncbi:helix-turn-helix domain-containing protein [Nocardioides dokdonensis]|uniref:helix-turn-helix domain-containing protein n=1 Tax=Nocardioides dokdonensis TaxID=450734 RepID=UPI000A041309|nr:helix-turn-helix domain-containing protein [Nocardioides dokdonensis]
MSVSNFVMPSPYRIVSLTLTRFQSGSMIVNPQERMYGIPVEVDEFRRQVGSRVADCRKQRGWSQQQLADVMQTHGHAWLQSTVAKTEAGARPLPVEELAALGTALGVRPASLMSDPVSQQDVLAQSLFVARSDLKAAERRLIEARGHAHAVQIELEEAQERVASLETELRQSSAGAEAE